MAPKLTEPPPTDAKTSGTVPLYPTRSWSCHVPLPDAAILTVEQLTALAAALAAAAEEARQEGSLALARELDYQQAQVRAEARRKGAA